MNSGTIQKKVEQLHQQGKLLEATSIKISSVRVVLVLVVILSLFSGYYMNKEYLYLVSLLALLIFIWLIKKHDKIIEEKEYIQTKEKVLLRYIDRYNNSWKEFEETGIEYLTSSHGIAKDLDIVGKQSLFQYISIANTGRGKKQLVKRLTTILYTIPDLQKQQEAVKELSNKQDFVLDLEIYGQMIPRKESLEKGLEEFITIVQLQKKQMSMGIFKYLIPMITITAIILAIFGIAFKWTVLLSAIFIGSQLVITGIMAYKNHLLFKQVVQVSSCFKRYYSICKIIEQQTFTSEYLLSLQDKMYKPNATKAIKELDTILDAIKQRSNVMAFLLFNSILLWDVHCKERFNQWILEYGESLDTWLEVIGELEALSSLQVILQIKPVTSFPSIESTKVPILQFKNLSHPLISNDKAIDNTFTMESPLCVITGSNMSGKTTFLRTIGLNLMLAYAGGPVLAKEWHSSLLQIYTSMRIEDDVSGISTFYGELLRVKEIVEASKQPNFMIAFIDEIFKGTNSNDRIIGAKETVKRLSLPHVLTFITTHDFELCQLEDDIKCSNYHFEEYYQDNKIYFDYKIKQGRSTTTNAQYLLKMVGIIED